MLLALLLGGRLLLEGKLSHYYCHTPVSEILRQSKYLLLGLFLGGRLIFLLSIVIFFLTGKVYFM